MHVRRVADKQEILDFLQQDRIYAAYAIGDLEPSLFEHCQWYVTEQGAEKTALCLFFKRLNPHALFTMGRSADLVLILGSALRPKRVYFTSRPEHRGVLNAFYSLGSVAEMARMVLIPEHFRPKAGPVTRLSLRHLHDLQKLYEAGGGDAFAPYQLEEGVYYGVEVAGRLVAVAGTHLVSPTYGLAAVGNVFTYPDYRNRGYATACTSAVVEELLGQGLDVVLNVSTTNAPALHIYEKMGFRQHCRYIEVLGVRKKG
ncbi:MAG: GNAT family N-acetyltransferase [Anaerolineae bacterium]